MNSGLIGKIEKAKRYAQERDRIVFSQLKVHFRGEHDVYDLSYDNGEWHCSCDFFSHRGFCSHSMAMERILGEMLPEASASPSGLS